MTSRHLSRKKQLVLLISTLLLIQLSGCLNQLDYRQEMREFIQDISAYAKTQQTNFSIITQNGIELITTGYSSNSTLATTYLQALDGLAQESLLYGYNNDDEPTPSQEASYLLDYLNKTAKPKLITDYCSSPQHIQDSYNTNNHYHHISYAAEQRELNILPSIQTQPYNINHKNIISLQDAKNFLYLINPDNYNSKQDFLNTLQETDYDILIIDAYYNDQLLTTQDIQSLKTKANGAKRLVISYMSIGEAEDYRYYWQDDWNTNPPIWLDEENPDWEGCYKVKYWHPKWQNIIYGTNTSYLDTILQSNFDGVYLDIIDAFEYYENTLTSTLQKNH